MTSINRDSSSTAENRLTIDLVAPSSWSDLTQVQLRYVLDLMAMELPSTAIKVRMFVRFTGLDITRKTRWGWRCIANTANGRAVVYLKTWMFQSFIHQMDFIDQLEDADCRLEAVGGLHAADPLLQVDVSFRDYLFAEKYYQLYIDTKDIRWMDNVAMWLYRDANGTPAGTGHAVSDDGRKVEEFELTAGERLGTLLWYGHVKAEMAKMFTHFFRPAPQIGDTSENRYIDQYNIQLRALTGGDPTKEAAVLSLECWRALTELDAKAREAEELESIRKKK